MKDGFSDLREPYRALLRAADRRLDELNRLRGESTEEGAVADIDNRLRDVTSLIDLIESAVDNAILRIR